MVGLGSLIFCLDSVENLTYHQGTNKLMLGLKGNYGNKGSITIELKILNSSVSFTNVHLFAGQHEVEKRTYALGKIEESLPSSDYFFMMGDFNFRC